MPNDLEITWPMILALLTILYGVFHYCWSYLPAIPADGMHIIRQTFIEKVMEAIDLPCKVIMDGEDEPYASVRRYNEIAKANKQLHEEMKHYADSIRAQFPHFSDNVKQPFRGKNQSTDALWKPARMPR